MNRLAPLAVLLLAGCAAAPKVTYWTDPVADADGRIKFYLASTDVTLAASEPAKKPAAAFGRVTLKLDGDLPGKVKAVATPAEHRAHLYALVPRGDAGVKARLAVAYRADADTSKLIHKLSVDTVDERKKMLSLLGSVGVALAAGGLLAVPSPRDMPPLELNLPVTVNSGIAADGQWRLLPNNRGWAYRFADQEEKDLLRAASLKAEDFFRRFDHEKGDSTTAFPLSACRRAVLQLRFGGKEPLTSKAEPQLGFNVVVADPRYVDALALPFKGTVQTHELCGADYSADASASALSDWEVMAELLAQVKAVKDAQAQAAAAAP